MVVAMEQKLVAWEKLAEQLNCALKDLLCEPNNALSQFKAEIQPIARVVAVEPKFVTGSQGNALPQTEAEIHQFSFGYQGGCCGEQFRILDFGQNFCFEHCFSSVWYSHTEKPILT